MNNEHLNNTQSVYFYTIQDFNMTNMRFSRIVSSRHHVTAQRAFCPRREVEDNVAKSSPSLKMIKANLFTWQHFWRTRLAWPILSVRSTDQVPVRGKTTFCIQIFNDNIQMVLHQKKSLAFWWYIYILSSFFNLISGAVG